jgi:ribosomal protein L44E
MPDLYCDSCRKATPHKIVMRRVPSEPCSKWQEIQRFMSLLARGDHYYEMEQQFLCRACNHVAERSVEKHSQLNVL